MQDFLNELCLINNDLDKNQYTARNFFSKIENSEIEIILNKPTVDKKLMRNCDVTVLTHIEFDTDPSLLTDDDTFTIFTGGSMMYNISFKLLTMTSKIENKNGKYLLPLNGIYFFHIATQYHGSTITLSINDTSFKKINLLTTEYCLSHEKQQHFVLSGLEKYVWCPKSICKTLNSSSVNYISDFGGFIDGYYLETNIANVKSILVDYWNHEIQKTILVNNEHLINYNASMIKTHCKMVNDNLLFIPLDVTKINLTNDSEFIAKYFYDKAVRQSFILKIVFFENEAKFKLHTFNYNVQKFISGMTGLSFDSYSYRNELNQVYNNMVNNNEVLEGITIYSQDLSEKYNDLPNSIIELIVNDPKEDLTNLPLFLQKLEIINNKSDIKIKCPFGCEYIERKINP